MKKNKYMKQVRATRVVVLGKNVVIELLSSKNTSLGGFQFSPTEARGLALDLVDAVIEIEEVEA